ncbi:MAG TPA: DivIVA domain-containing protein [Nitrospinota bacterium]|nr:DivIVA domain-containing protein [Nitrospinota bacterium]
MKITPLDIRQQQFNVRFRGFDAEEVDTFLEIVANEYEEIIEENKKLKGELEKKKEQIKLYMENEEKLKRMLKSNQKLKDEIAGTAGKEAQLIIKDAELRAREILGSSHKEVEKIKIEIQELKKHKKQLQIKIRSIIESYLKLLEKEDEGGK